MSAKHPQNHERQWTDHKRAKYRFQSSVWALFDKITFRELLTAILLMIQSAGTTMLTYYGVSFPLAEMGGGIVQKGQALAFALTIGTLAWLGWFYMFGLIYRISGKRLASALAASIVYMSIITAIDAQFNMLALGGGSAVQLTLVDTARHYEAKKESQFRKVTIARRILPAINAQAARFRQLQRDEEKYGTYSGSPGPGRVSSGFGQIAALLEHLSKELILGLEVSQKIQGNVTAKLRLIKSQAYKSGPIRPRINAVSNAADELDDLLGRLGQYDFSASIRASLTSLEHLFPPPGASKSAFQKVQNEQLAMIAKMAIPVSKALREALDSLPAGALVKGERVRPQSAMQAIRTKWRELFSQWLAAIFIDIAPGALLIIQIAAFGEVEARRSGKRRRRPRRGSRKPPHQDKKEKSK